MLHFLFLPARTFYLNTNLEKTSKLREFLVGKGSDLVPIHLMASPCPPLLWTLEGASVAFTELLFEQNWPSFHYTAQFYREDVIDCTFTTIFISKP